MTSTLITGIGELVTNVPALGDGSSLGLVRGAALVIDDGAVAWVGLAAGAPAADERGVRIPMREGDGGAA